MSINGGLHADARTKKSAGASTNTSADSHQMNGFKESGPSRSPAADSSPVPSANMPPPTTLPNAYAVKSEKAQGKARQVEGLDSKPWHPLNGHDYARRSQETLYNDTPADVLLAELLPQTENLIPLFAVVERMSNYGYEALQVLSETLPSLSSDQRREKIFTTAVTVQRQLAKLVALALWSRLAGDLQKTRDTVGLLCEQYAQAEDAVRELTGIRMMLPQSRVRNFDLLTAADVLRTGTYARLPTVIKTSAISQKPMDDKEVDELIQELEDTIRLRLACYDVLPVQMSDYRIADGRAHFRVPGLFEASLTVDGPYPSGRWYLLTIKFLFRVKGAGRDRFPRVPKKHFRDLLLEQVNAELAPPPPLPPEDSEGANEVLDQQARSSLSAPPSPLMNFYRHLENRALQYQLDILSYQASELSHSTWKGHLVVERDAQPQALRLMYWSQPGSQPSVGRTATKQPWRRGGTLTISVKAREGSKGTGRALSRILFGASETSDVESLEQKQLDVRWDVEKSVKARSSSAFAIDINALDVRALLMDVVSTHISAILSSLQNRILDATMTLGVFEDGCKVCQVGQEGEQEAVPYLMVKLCDTLTVIIKVHHVSGQISIEEKSRRVPDAFHSNDVGNQADTAMFKQSGERLNQDADQIVEVLQALRQWAICKDLEQKASFLGLDVIQRLPLQATEYAKLYALPDALVFFALAGCPNWYIAAQFAAHPPRVALLSTATYMLNGQVYTILNTLQWLDRSKVLRSLVGTERSDDPQQRNLADIDLDEIAHLHWHGVAIVSYFRIEQQVQARNLPFMHTSSLPPLVGDGAKEQEVGLDMPISKVASRMPALALRSQDILGRSSVLVKPNVFVVLSRWWDASATSARIVVRLTLRSGSRLTKLEPGDTNGTIEYDAKTRQLTFKTSDIDNCITWFLMEWDRLSRLGMLIKTVERARRWPEGRARGFRVLSFDFFEATFAYAARRYATVTWSRSLAGQPGSEGFLLKMSSDAGDATGHRVSQVQGKDTLDADEDLNPHERVEAALEQTLNAGSSLSPGFWPSFLCLLYETLPVLEMLQDASKAALTDADAPDLEMRSACWYRLTYATRYALDVRYLAGSRFIIADGSKALLSTGKGGITSELDAIPAFHRITKEAVSTYYSSTAAARDDEAATPSTPVTSGPGLTPPPAVDLRRAVLCAAEATVVKPILGAMLALVREHVQMVKGSPSVGTTRSHDESSPAYSLAKTPKDASSSAVDARETPAAAAAS